MATITQNFARNIKKLPFYLQGISNIDVKVDDMIDSNRLAYSRKETSGEYEDLISDDYGYNVGAAHRRYNRIETPAFVPNYEERKNKFYRLASLPEIERVLHNIADESIVYNDNNEFCAFNSKKLSNLKPEMIGWIEKAFKKIYSLWEFDDGQTAWEFFLKFMIEGFAAFEIVYDDKDDPEEITGFVELDPNTLIPSRRKNDDGEIVKVWIQKARTGAASMGTRVVVDKIIPDESIIFIGFNRTGGNYGRISYVERLERSFNIMRIMEDTKAGWVIMNSQHRMKIILPVNTRNTDKAKQALAKITAKYKEDLYIDEDNGEFKINGESRINFGKLFVLPNRAGQEPSIEGVKFDGPDMQDMQPTEYFSRKFQRDTQMPFSRFDRENGGGANILFEATGVPHDEMSYYQFINRIRREFSQLIIKPLYLQVLMKYPQLKEEKSLRLKLGLEFESNFMMQEAKKAEAENRAIDRIQNAQQIQKPNGDPVFSTGFLVQKYWPWSKEEMQTNNKMLKAEASGTESLDTGENEAPKSENPDDEFGFNDQEGQIVPDEGEENNPDQEEEGGGENEEETDSGNLGL